MKNLVKYNVRANYVVSSYFTIKSYHTKKQKNLITGYFTPCKAVRYIRKYTYSALVACMDDKNIFGYTSDESLKTFLKESKALLLYKSHNFIGKENIHDYELYDKYREVPIANKNVMMAGENASTEAGLVADMKDEVLENNHHDKDCEIVRSIVNEVPVKGTNDRSIHFYIERGC